MADVAEPYGGPPAVDQTGNLTIWAIPAGTAGVNLDAITAANLGATTAKRITYSFTEDGWNPSPTQAKLTDNRLTSPQGRQSLDRVVNEVPDITVVDSSDAASAAEILKAGGDWIFVERRNVPQTTLAAAAQKVRAYSLSLGTQRPGPITNTGKFTKQHAVAVNYISAEHALS
jgi:hypothetical protein